MMTSMADVSVHEAALAGILCRSGLHHPQYELGAPTCGTCVGLAEYARVAMWSDAVAVGWRQAGEAIAVEIETELKPPTACPWTKNEAALIARAIGEDGPAA